LVALTIEGFRYGDARVHDDGGKWYERTARRKPRSDKALEEAHGEESNL
jgi:hypothetical protein